jgi:hypothetical protein
VDEDTRQHLNATRSVVKAAMRANRTALAFLADLDERLGRDLGEPIDAQPEEAQRNGSRSSEPAEATVSGR